MDPGKLHINEEQAYRIAYLIAGFIRENLTIDEQTELDAWVLAEEDNMFLFEKLTDEVTLTAFQQWLIITGGEAEMGILKDAIEFSAIQEFSQRNTIRGREACLLIERFLYFYFNQPFPNE